MVGSIVREVTQVSPDIRIATRDEAGKTLDDAQFRSAGLQTRGSLGPGAGAFEPPLELRPFPLRPGHQWTQKTRMSDAYWRETRLMRVTGRVEAWEAVRIGGRDMRALRIIRSMSLGDADGFRGDTQRTEWEWWVPEVRAPARLIVWEEHREPDGRFGELIIDRHVRYELEEARLARP